MGITSLDPIKYDLMFERFINPDRPDKPDIDVDVQKSHRLGIKAYIGKQYHDENVCSIGTRSRSGPKQSIYDIAKALDKMPGNGIEIPFTKIKEMAEVVGRVDKSDEVDNEEEPDAEPPTWSETLAGDGRRPEGVRPGIPEALRVHGDHGGPGPAVRRARGRDHHQHRAATGQRAHPAQARWRPARWRRSSTCTRLRRWAG